MRGCCSGLRPRPAARRLLRTTADFWRPPASIPEAPLPASSRARLSTSVSRVAPIVQAMPRGAYYDVLLTSPPPYAATKSEGPPVTAHAGPTADEKQEQKGKDEQKEQQQQQQQQQARPPSADQEDEPPRQTAQQRARIVFGSRLAGPMERENRLAAIRQRSRLIAGVLVPPRPDEPDNCCMSGCVNCVWDRFRDEMEAWAAASAEASRRLKAQEGGVAAGVAAGVATAGSGGPAASAMSMDDDGGGSDTNWSLDEVVQANSGGAGAGGWDEALYKGVPVGIREFMKQEKRLKLKHMREGTTGG